MADLPTPAEFVSKGQGVFRTAIDPTGTGAVNLASGSRNDTLLSLLVALAARLTAYTADRIAASRRSSATGDDLRLIARDLFGDDPKDAVASFGTVYLQRSGTAATTIPNGSRVGVPAAPGQQAVPFAASRDVTVALNQLKAAVPVTCTQTGIVGNVSRSAITAILDALPDATWTVFQPAPGDSVLAGGVADVIGGGADAESDDVVKARLAQTAIDDSRQRGVRRAILKAVLAVPGVRWATVIEPLDGTIIIYAGDSSFALPAALASSVLTALLDWRGFGVPAIVRAYNATLVTVTATIYMARALANYDTVGIRTAAIAALKAYFDARTSPDEYFLNGIESALFRAHDEVQDAIITLPAATVLRPTDPGYGAITALNRYYLADANLNLTIAPPRTL